ncbi:MAG TPA: NAD(P)/FAD-dependent oxidoreductase [Cyclobacteriaceae bacterium]|nr:NAD(P)/FAD-dependent oxidoreductase [Cyclobacteriaceae bacterium]
MKRRKALQQISTGLTASLLAPQLFSSCKKEDAGPKVKFDGTIAIIGAGAAGLYAADILNAQGLDVFILEARNNLGGRIRSFSTSDSQANNSTDAFIYDYRYPSIADFPIELGGDLVMGSDSSWGKIISILGLPTIDLGTANHQYILDNIPKPTADWQGDADFNAVQSFVSGLKSYNGPDVSIKSAANVSSRAQALLNAQAGNFYGSTADRISALGLANELKLQTHDSKILTVKSNPWQDVLLSRFNQIVKKVQLNTPVSSIDYSGETITIKDKSGKQYTANKVIVTVPLSILQNNGIAFSPSLPSTNIGAMHKFGMSSCIRLVIDFKKNFWGETSGLIWGGSIAPQYFNSGFNRSQFNSTMVVTICGQAAELLSTFGASMINPALAEIDGLYNGQGSKWVRRKIVNDASGVPHETDPITFIYDWSKDPYIKGGYSYPLVGAGHQDRINLGTAIPGGKIFFAGEATDVNGDAGTVSGALQSAERVAQELIKSITA